MTRAAFMLLHAILALAFGIAFVLAPASVLGLYGVTTDPAGTFMARLWGAAAIQIGLAAWLARKDIDTPARRAVQLGNAGGLAVGFVIALLSQLAGLSVRVRASVPAQARPASKVSSMRVKSVRVHPNKRLKLTAHVDYGMSPSPVRCSLSAIR